MTHIEQEAARLAEDWKNNARWEGIVRDYTAEDVVRLRGSIREQYTLAYRMAEKLWDMLGTQDYINSLGALSGGQAVQMVRAGLKSIYLSGWQVAGDGNRRKPDGAVHVGDSTGRSQRDLPAVTGEFTQFLAIGRVECVV